MPLTFGAVPLLASTSLFVPICTAQPSSTELRSTLPLTDTVLLPFKTDTEGDVMKAIARTNYEFVFHSIARSN
ncbi:hypothetical protein [Marinomonas sp.]|uniref:hypothetical protein n=1 Tax=Marinomonas sp. TaxID=1904862 RepID=UPI003F9C2F8F